MLVNRTKITLLSITLKQNKLTETKLETTMKSFIRIAITLFLLSSATSAFAEGYFFSRDFVSYYTVNGQNVDADLEFTGNRGTYYTEDGRNGSFSNVMEWSDGKVLTGYWDKNGQSGTFQFDMTNLNTGEFDGFWKGDNGTSGNWHGRYR